MTIRKYYAALCIQTFLHTLYTKHYDMKRKAAESNHFNSAAFYTRIDYTAIVIIFNSAY